MIRTVVDNVEILIEGDPRVVSSARRDGTMDRVVEGVEGGVERIGRAIRAIARATGAELRAGAEEVSSPREVELKFSVTLEASTNAVLVKQSGTAGIEVTLKWGPPKGDRNAEVVKVLSPALLPVVAGTWASSWRGRGS